MKLHSPQFERTIRRAVKKNVRRSPELKREARRVKKRRQSPWFGAFLRLLFAVGVGGIIAAIAKATGHPATALAAISLWTFIGIAYRTQSLLHVLFRAHDLPA